MKKDFKHLIKKSFTDRSTLETLKKNHDLQYNKAVTNIVEHHFKESKMSLPQILNRVTSKGYKIFQSGSYNLNIIGVRTSSREANKFDDWLHVVFKDETENWIDIRFQITTDAGLYHLNNPSRVEGTAILVSGQYRGSHKIGLHRGKYEALTQVGKVKVYRDNTKDEVLDHDPSTIQEGYFGINIHRSNSTRESTQVDKWSAGCQVFANPNEYDMFISLCKRSAERWGDTFTYTLLED
tara:strand:- start:13635 stop:14348 length:714 start_codon:yes stop_codon:yes gene_type:complete